MSWQDVSNVPVTKGVQLVFAVLNGRTNVCGSAHEGAINNIDSVYQSRAGITSVDVAE